MLGASLLLFGQGCASTGRYLADRGHDAADVVTCTLGIGVGAKARVGPVQLGLLINRDVVGLRGGAFHWWPEHEYQFDSIQPGEYDFVYLSGDFFRDTRSDDTRGKLYTAGGLPLIKEVDLNVSPARRQRLTYYHTQIEIVAALLGSVRLGLNPGELVDFILGWFGVDFFHDDIGKLPEASPDLGIDLDGYE